MWPTFFSFLATEFNFFCFEQPWVFEQCALHTQYFWSRRYLRIMVMVPRMWHAILCCRAAHFVCIREVSLYTLYPNQEKKTDIVQEVKFTECDCPSLLSVGQNCIWKFIFNRNKCSQKPGDCKNCVFCTINSSYSSRSLLKRGNECTAQVGL